jgi:hypothetical protein
MSPWYDELFHPSLWDWGDVATWVTGIFTAGTLMLGLYLLRRDSTKEQSSQARSVVVFEEGGVDTESGGVGAAIHIWNFSERPIFNLELHWQTKDGTGGPGGDIQWFLEPGGRTSTTYELPNESPRIYLGIYFDDVEGNAWVFNLLTHKLEPERSFVRMTKKARRRAGLKVFKARDAVG